MVSLERLWLGVLLIAGVSAILLLSDVDRRQSGDSDIKRVALLQYGNSPLMEAGVSGMKAGLSQRGYTEGPDFELRIYRAEGDMPTANAIASEISSGQFDLIMTSGTPAMQAVANANRAGQTPHVFGLVADPPGAGVGISRTDPLDHPAHLVGVGSMLPVEPGFQLLRQMNPQIKVVGEVWNPAESNSEAFTIKAREVCEKLGIELLEANVDNSAGVHEAANSLVSRGAEALWITGDNTVATAANSVMAAGNAGKIPTFSILTGNAEQGALLEVGADFREVGRLTGVLAAKILDGTDPASVPVTNRVPEMISVNTTALAGLRGSWTIPADLLERADVIIDETGVHKKAEAAAKGPLARKWKLKIISYVEAPSVEETLEGVQVGLEEAGLVKGRDFDDSFVSAQGDIATANSIIDAAVTDRTELIISLNTPMLQASLNRARDIPIVFTQVANPLLAGAGKSNDDHQANITGNYVVSPFDRMMKVMKECLPGVRRIGTLFVPAEVNSVYYKDLLVEAAGKVGVEVEVVGVNTPADVADAALSLASTDIQVLCQISDNLSGATFAPITQAAKRFKLPLFTFNSTHADQGVTIIVARDYFDGGREAGHLAARVMRGESPAAIPFQPVEKVKFIVNLQEARKVGLQIPQSLLDRADEVIQ
jgi:ABC-type uncharacterized transport system substrate-binding protein